MSILTKKEKGNVDSRAVSALEESLLFDIANNEFLTTEEVAVYMRTTVGAIRTATSNGRIPPHCYRKPGKRNLYIKSEIRKLLMGLPH